MDAFKALALGATAVSAGRVVMEPLKNDGAQGVQRVIKNMTAELKWAMAVTCSRDIRSIDPSVIWTNP
jgi:isopentenyl diphosphate isomerase/L-lactate dehydrogenase-like FMN-dependent dehydrogenase